MRLVEKVERAMRLYDLVFETPIEKLDPMMKAAWSLHPYSEVRDHILALRKMIDDHS